MRNDEYQAKKIKYAVFDARRNGKGFVVRPLTQGVKAQLESKFTVEPYIYEVELKFPIGFKPTDTTSYAVKDMYFYKKKHKGAVRIMHLRPSWVKACRDFGMGVRLLKYKIY